MSLRRIVSGETFQSTPLMRGETRRGGWTARSSKFQSTPLTRGETRRAALWRGQNLISIHSPHARGDITCTAGASNRRKFQSTPLMRGETINGIDNGIRAIQFQSTPLMRGETVNEATERQGLAISIHSPHARGDTGFRFLHGFGKQFQSTPLMRGETVMPGHLRSEPTLFQSTPLMRGETSSGIRLPATAEKFQSTPLMRGETRNRRRGRTYQHISIHSPHARGDASLYFLAATII